MSPYRRLQAQLEEVRRDRNAEAFTRSAAERELRELREELKREKAVRLAERSAAAEHAQELSLAHERAVARAEGLREALLILARERAS